MFGLKHLRIQTKVLITLGVFGIVPILIGLLIVQKGVQQSKDAARESLALIAGSGMDVIERNLFERYGDVQAFGLNTAVNDRDSWYKTDDTNAVTKVMNKYMATYTPVYDLMLFVDLEGRVVAASSVAWDGNPINTKSLFAKNFKREIWFQNAISGQFTESEALTGTWVDDFQSYDYLAKIFGHDGYALAYSAPVKDANGKVIGVWRNYARPAVIQGIFAETLSGMADAAKGQTSLTLYRQDGEPMFLAQAKPDGASFDHVFGKDAQDGVQALIPSLGAGQIQTKVLTGTNTGDGKAVAVAKSEGALGYPGLGWSIGLQTSASHFFSKYGKILDQMYLFLFAGILVVAIVGILLARLLTRPIVALTHGLQSVAQGKLDFEITHRGHDEIGAASESCRAMKEYLLDKADVAHRVAEGDTTVKVKLASPEDELGLSLQEMVANLSDVIRQIRGCATGLSAKSQYLRASSQTVETTAHEMRESAEQVSEAMEEAARSTMEISSGSETLAHNVSSIAEEAALLQQAMAEMHVSAEEQASVITTSEAEIVEAAQAIRQSIQGTQRVREQIGNSAAQANQLDEKSDQIGRIVQAIEEIADQTNLLALNAAIEAARAGEAGRGFTVVAEEVRKLAERSQDAAREIGALIGDVREDLSKTVVVMHSSVEEVEQVSQFAESLTARVDSLMATLQQLRSVTDQNQSALSRMNSSVTNVTEAITGAAAIAQQSAAGAQEVSSGTEEVTASIQMVTHGIVHTVESISSIQQSAEELDVMAEQLMESVNQFRTEQDDRSAPRAGRAA